MKISAFVAVAALASAAFAGGPPSFVGGSYNTLSNAFSGGPNLNSIVNSAARGGTSTVTFSTDVAQPNVLSLTGSAGFNVAPEQFFSIASVSYFNGITYTGDQGVDGALSVEFDAPAGLGTQVFNFNYDFTITANTTGDPVLDGDFLNFQYPALPNFITIGDDEYTLAIVGFRLPSGQLLNTLQLPEGSTVNADIIARFTTDRVPAPGAAALMGLAGVFAGRRRR